MTTKTLTSHEEFLLDLLRVLIATNAPKLATQTKAVLEIASKIRSVIEPPSGNISPRRRKPNLRSCSLRE